MYNDNGNGNANGNLNLNLNVNDNININFNDNNMRQPRGLRNNNPLNIRKSRKTTWVGQSEKQEDRDFVQFCSMAYGYRAAFKVLQNYRVLYDCMTLRQYIQRWAPPIENNTDAYVSSVARTAGVNPDALLPSPRKGRAVWVKIVAGMHLVENGMMPVVSRIEEGWELAFAKI